jgi:hypothetical protein
MKFLTFPPISRENRNEMEIWELKQNFAKGKKTKMKWKYGNRNKILQKGTGLILAEMKMEHRFSAEQT